MLEKLTLDGQGCMVDLKALKNVEKLRECVQTTIVWPS